MPITLRMRASLSLPTAGAAGDTTPTDSRSRRNRASRRGGQLLTRALSSSYRSACPHFRAPGASVPDGRTIRRDQPDRSRILAPTLSYRLQTPSNACTRNLSDGSRPKPCCRARKPPPCCSGPCWPRGRSSCERSMVGQPSPRSLPIRSLTSPHDRITSRRWRSPQANSNTDCDGTSRAPRMGLEPCPPPPGPRPLTRPTSAACLQWRRRRQHLSRVTGAVEPSLPQLRPREPSLRRRAKPMLGRHRRP